MTRCEKKYGYGSRPDETRTNEMGWDVRNNLHYNGVGGSPLARYSTWVRFRLGRVGVILCYVGVELPYLGVWLEYDLLFGNRMDDYDSPTPPKPIGVREGGRGGQRRSC